MQKIQCEECQEALKEGHWDVVPPGYGTDVKPHQGPGMEKPIMRCLGHRNDHTGPYQSAFGPIPVW